MQKLDLIFQRKSVRTFQKKAVPKELIEQMVKAGMAAPSAMNKQPWYFVAITNREVLDNLGEQLPNTGMLKHAPAALVVCGDLHNTLPGKAQEFWVQDCVAATENILLAAEALGLGAVWTGAYPLEERYQLISEALSLPEHIIPLNVIPFGYPQGDPKPKDKWAPEKLHWEQW